MPRKPSFIKLTEGEIEEFNDDLKRATKTGHLRWRRRLQIIWFSHQGYPVQRIARFLGVSQQTVWKYRRIYKAQGLAGLRGKYRSRKL